MHKRYYCFTKKEAGYVNRFFSQYCYESVETAYGKPSPTKISIENDIKSFMENDNGWGYRIISKNGFHFSCGYLAVYNGITTLVIFTPSKWWIKIPLECADLETGEIIGRRF